MKNYEINVKRMKDKEDGLRSGCASILINGAFEINGIRISETMNQEKNEPSLHVVWPFNKKGDEFEPIIFPNKDIRDEIKQEILDKFNNMSQELNMEVVRVSRFDSDSSLKGFATVDVNGFTIKNIRIMENADETLFVSFPSYSVKDKDEKVSYTEYCYPVIKGAREQLKEIVLTAYDKAAEKEVHKEADENLPDNGAFIDSDNERNQRSSSR